MINLILAIIGLIAGVWTILRAMAQRREEKNEEEARRERGYYGQDADEDAEKRTQRRPGWIVLTVILGIAGFILFILTENMRLPMALIDRWTIVNAILLIVGIVAARLPFKRREDDKDEDETQDVKMTPVYGK